jgi:hypothetical protein
MSSELRKLFNEVKNHGPRFLEGGEVSPHFVLEFDHVNDKSAPLSIEVSLRYWSNDDDEHLMMSQLRAKIGSYGRLLRYCYVCEIWATPNAKERPSLSPDRTEYLLVKAEERDGPLLSSLAAIQRDPAGVPSLASWQDVISEYSLLGDMFEEAAAIN